MTDATTAEELDETTEDAQAVVETPEVFQPVTLPNGMPFFVVDSDDMIDRIINAGYGYFYCLGTHVSKIDITQDWERNQGKQKFKDGPSEPRLYKVINNLVTKAIIPIDDDDLGGVTVLEKKAWFTMAPIPFELIQKMDSFFRRVDEKLGTEAILVLTYDMRYVDAENPEDGWGVIVPQQRNSGAHCKYEPTTVLDSIADEDEEFIRIVGSAHSHPGMGAFASHTDHGDQVGNDGIHITFGWNHNGNTAFHIEMQVGEYNWLLREEHAFGPRPDFEMTDEIEDWTKNVEAEDVVPPKAISTPIVTPFRPTASTTFGTDDDPNWGKVDSTSRIDEFGLRWNHRIDKIQVPDGVPYPRGSVLFVNLIRQDEGKCPICQGIVLEQDRTNHACNDCHAFLLMGEEKPQDITRIRAELESPHTDQLIKRWEAALDRGIPVAEIYRWFDENTGALRSSIIWIQEAGQKKA